MASMWHEFRKFLMRGNVIDLAVGVVLGASFGKIVSSLVSDVLMPPIGLMLGRVNFSNLFIDLSRHGYQTLAEAKSAGAPTLNYGVFLNNVLDFVIIAFAIFILVKAVNRLHHREAQKPSPPSEPSGSEKLLIEIRDILRVLSKEDRQPPPPF